MRAGDETHVHSATSGVKMRIFTPHALRVTVTHMAPETVKQLGQSWGEINNIDAAQARDRVNLVSLSVSIAVSIQTITNIQFGCDIVIQFLSH